MTDKLNLLIFGILCIAVILFISGGNFITNREFFSAEPYAPTVSANGNEIPNANTYSELKKEILKMISRARVSGNVHLMEYSGNAEADIKRVCEEICEKTPLGAFAAENISVSCTRVLSFYDIKVTITYKRSAEEIMSVVEAASADDVEEQIKKAVSEHRPYVVLLNRYYTPVSLNINDIFENLRFNYAMELYGLSGYKFSLFPDVGMDRIILIELQYHESIESSRNRQAETAKAEAGIVASLGGSRDISEICRAVMSDVELVEENPSFTQRTPYGALVEKKADSEGMATALKKVCNGMNIYANVIKGELYGKVHFWNTVFTDGEWRHTDLSRGIIAVPSSEMTGYTWQDSEI